MLRLQRTSSYVFKSQLIDQTAAAMFQANLLSHLDNWTSPARPVLSVSDPHQPHMTEEESEQALRLSKEDEQHIQSLLELDRENAILERCAKTPHAKQDRVLGATFQSSLTAHECGQQRMHVLIRSAISP